VSVRVYLPTSLDDLAGYVAAGVVPVAVERFVAQDSDEESEYSALVAAAEASAALGAARRVVLVAELDDPDAPVALARLAAVHADPAAGADPDDDLGWYAVQEIPDLLGTRDF
jgi:hypothetical protein